MLFFGPYLRRAVGKIVGKNSLWQVDLVQNRPSCETLLHMVSCWQHDDKLCSWCRLLALRTCTMWKFGDQMCTSSSVFFFFECTIWPVPLALVLWESWLLPGEVGFDKCYKMLSFCCFLIHLHYLLYFLAGYKLHNTFELHSVLRQQVSYGWSEHWQTLCQVINNIDSPLVLCFAFTWTISEISKVNFSKGKEWFSLKRTYQLWVSVLQRKLQRETKVFTTFCVILE